MTTRNPSWLATLATTAALALGSGGCVQQMILDGQLEATRKASATIDTLSDYEVANSAAFAGIAQLEGLHYLAPDNEDGLYLLTQAWFGATFAFIEETMEQAEDVEGTEGELYLYHQARAKAGYDRAIHYGIQLLEQKHPGFQDARKNDDTMKAWLATFTDPAHDVPNLFWTANAWLSKTNIAKEDPALVADLFIGAAMMQRAVALDEKYLYGSGHIALGAYHARSPMAELDEGKKHFDRALAISGGKYLIAKLMLAIKYHCIKGEREPYEKLLNEVLAAGDLLPEQRLSNTIAKRRAKRYLGKERMKSCGF
jgi:hypothetical protein